MPSLPSSSFAHVVVVGAGIRPGGGRATSSARPWRSAGAERCSSHPVTARNTTFSAATCADG